MALPQGSHKGKNLKKSYLCTRRPAGPVKAKFHMAPPWAGGTKVCSQHLGYVIEMAGMPIYSKNI